jgi:hypothetical protein
MKQSKASKLVAGARRAAEMRDGRRYPPKSEDYKKVLQILRSILSTKNVTGDTVIAELVFKDGKITIKIPENPEYFHSLKVFMKTEKREIETDDQEGPPIYLIPSSSQLDSLIDQVAANTETGEEIESLLQMGEIQWKGSDEWEIVFPKLKDMELQ